MPLTAGHLEELSRETGLEITQVQKLLDAATRRGIVAPIQDLYRRSVTADWEALRKLMSGRGGWRCVTSSRIGQAEVGWVMNDVTDEEAFSDDVATIFLYLANARPYQVWRWWREGDDFLEVQQISDLEALLPEIEAEPRIPEGGGASVAGLEVSSHDPVTD